MTTNGIQHHTPTLVGLHYVKAHLKKANETYGKIWISQTPAMKTTTDNIWYHTPTVVGVVIHDLLSITTHSLWWVCGNTWSLPSVTTHPTSTQTSPQYLQPPKPGVPAPHNGMSNCTGAKRAAEAALLQTGQTLLGALKEFCTSRPVNYLIS
ncbi:hypothetical protein BS47DRAFT_1366725 [Hydnum rufescens UP504]|uniref:Uncharacterized protein n=1 Tax=Hydnum rufescens UP504 TaxID=1448309 RepID=A0A9P6AK62_9AGAM|nr:hypothetical protein BS47DRAFT_1366725 [Hydnum rufescens UP504]